VGYDLTAFFDFWGVKDITPTPADEATLRGHMQAHNLAPSLKVRCLLLRYKELIPADNAAFNDFFDAVYPGRPAGGASPLYGQGWFNAWRDTYTTTHGTAAKARIDDILAKHFSGTANCAGVDTGGPGVDVARPTTYEWLIDSGYANASTSAAWLPPPPSPPSPPSPPPPPLPVPPFAPLGDGEAIVVAEVTVLTVTLTVAGDVHSVDEQALAESLRERLACSPPCVLTLTLTPASVLVTSELAVPASDAAAVNAVSAAADALVATAPAALGTALGVTVESINPTVGVQSRTVAIQVAPPPPSPAQPAASGPGLGTGALVGIIAGAMGVAGLLVALWFKQRSLKVGKESPRSPGPAIMNMKGAAEMTSSSAGFVPA
jgi:hypothetical protein